MSVSITDLPMELFDEIDSFLPSFNPDSGHGRNRNLDYSVPPPLLDIGLDLFASERMKEIESKCPILYLVSKKFRTFKIVERYKKYRNDKLYEFLKNISNYKKIDKNLASELFKSRKEFSRVGKYYSFSIIENESNILLLSGYALLNINVSWTKQLKKYSSKYHGYQIVCNEKIFIYIDINDIIKICFPF